MVIIRLWQDFVHVGMFEAPVVCQMPFARWLKHLEDFLGVSVRGKI